MKHGDFTINEPYTKTPYDRVASLTFYYMRNKTKKNGENVMVGHPTKMTKIKHPWTNNGLRYITQLNKRNHEISRVIVLALKR